jgi:hypothetical protein
MDESFVPLFPAAGVESRAFEPCRAKILPGASVPASNGGGPSPVASRPPTASPARPGSAAPLSGHANPVVTVERDGERVSRIHIVCCCGQVIDLDCAY